MKARKALANVTYGKKTRQLKAVMAMAVLLSACQAEPPPPAPTPAHARLKTKSTQPAPAPSPPAAHYDAADYLLSLAQARLILSDDPNDVETIQPYLHMLEEAEAASEYKPSQPATVIHYTTGNNKTRREVLVPLQGEREAPLFTNLQTVMDAMEKRAYTLHDMRVVEVDTATMNPMTFKGLGGTQIAALLAQKHAQLAERTHPVSPLTCAKTELALTQLFLQTRIRDAAYLALENGKHCMAASAVEPGVNEAEINRLTQEEFDLEAALHKTMPYTF
jgi:hypothetical protein